ncbi:uncharacterized protein FOMMEDRAFT_152223 [Fomitiporia mediterranea MF3/22]|uniref:uncharacterized protein n=1 Tax=Fomitiporia mediterranea (strain MF3/22) TaxID=694068 RepID=UPI0004408EAC|nr:uncharacterized protein FOMMEDRAFT_152223 [Fomitiporia mediterranea MF3/22]EJD06896.1 hypothetical protein FOMMEDRAFT_152223 [Fomitiporia mediterranea MF3/22]
MYSHASSSRLPIPAGPTEFDILKASHKFLREDDADNTNGKENENRKNSWEDRLAQKYYASLYREFAVCDLKHYKSGNFALRWRTEDEVVSGAGEETCGNTRCPLHAPLSSLPSSPLGLKTVELPFAYAEHGEQKQALVKVVLCETCLRKLMWKREKEKEKGKRRMLEDGRTGSGNRSGEDLTTTRSDELVRKERGVDVTRESGMEEKEREDRERRRKSRNGDGDEHEHDRRRKRAEEESRKRDRLRSRSPSHRRHRGHRDGDGRRQHERLPPT